MTGKTPKISVAIIALNEADRIGALLKSLVFADEIVVVDSGSTDRTVAICEESGARVIYNPWPGFAAQKQFAMEQASNQWVLNLDADEVVSHDLALEIKAALQSVPENINGFSMPRLSRYLGRWIRRGGWYPDRKLRLVRKHRAKWTGDGLHETLMAEGDTVEFEHPILHSVYRGIEDQVNTINKFSRVFAQQNGEKQKSIVFWGVLRAIGKFFECYIYKLGFLDGVPGLVIAMNSSWYVFLKYAKSWEVSIGNDDSAIDFVSTNCETIDSKKITERDSN